MDATRIGAFAFLEKPITMQKLLKAVEQGLARNAARPCGAVGGRNVVIVRHGAARCWQHARHHGGRPWPLGAPGFDLDRPLREAVMASRRPTLNSICARGRIHDARRREDGLERTHLYRKLRQLGVDLGRGKRA